jgi:hypothetical protein
MKKFIVIIFLLCMVSIMRPTWCMAAFENDVIILEKRDIEKLSDEQLLDEYLNTIVEVEASKAFHNTSGFSPKDYKEYKGLLKFRLLLLLEIHNRNLEIPQLER